jgi:hypothetical protein
LKFPDFENGGYYELAGIQDTEFGEQVIDFWDIFDFEVGDVQQRYSYFNHPPHTKVRNTKILFNSKEIFNDHITYDVYKLTKGYDIWSNGGGYYDYSDIYSGTISYSLEEYERVNNFQNELILLEGYYCEQTGDDFLFGKISVNIDSLNLKTKHFGIHFNSPLFQGLYFEASTTNDTLITYFGECISNGPHGITYTESLGVTLKTYDDNFETIDYNYLIGYIKDGDTIGIIHPDSTFITGIKNQSIADNYSIYPNPTDDLLYIKPQDLGNSKSYSIKLRDVLGQLVWGEMDLQSSLYAIDISSLQSGVHFYEIKESSGNIQKGKFIVK